MRPAVSVSFDLDTIYKLKKKAEKDKTNVSKVVSDFVENGFEREKKS